MNCINCLHFRTETVFALAVSLDRIKQTKTEHCTYQITCRTLLKPSDFADLTPSKKLDCPQTLGKFEYVLFSRLCNIQFRQCTFNVQFFILNVQFAVVPHIQERDNVRRRRATLRRMGQRRHVERSAGTQKRGQDVQAKPRRHTCILVFWRNEQRGDRGIQQKNTWTTGDGLWLPRLQVPSTADIRPRREEVD